MRALVLILDSVGIGAAPDAADYGDTGCNTLAHCAEAVGGLRLPTLAALGLGNAAQLAPGGLPILGVAPAAAPGAGFGAMREVSVGKDTTTGHWELAGLRLEQGFHRFPAGPPSFPAALTAAFERRTGRKVLGNRAASGTAIIEALGRRQIEEGRWIVYTSADSVFQIAAHERVIPLEELYRACAIARELCDGYRVGRVIARPFEGEPGAFRRTERRRDYSMPPPEPTVFEKLTAAGVPVTGVGKVADIYAHRGITRSEHTGNNAAGEAAVLELARDGVPGVILANLNDFDSLYGHRRDPAGYARALEGTDRFLGRLLPALTGGDTLIVTADHGNDPTFTGTDHTREIVPLLAYRPGVPGRSLGLRTGFFDVAQSLAALFGIAPLARGRSFIDQGTLPPKV